MRRCVLVFLVLECDLLCCDPVFERDENHRNCGLKNEQQTVLGAFLCSGVADMSPL